MMAMLSFAELCCAVLHLRILTWWSSIAPCGMPWSGTLSTAAGAGKSALPPPPPPPPPSMRMQCSHDDLAGLLLCASGTTLSHKTHATVVAALHSDSMCCCICAMVIRENYNVPSTISNRIRAKTIYQVFEPG